MTEPKCYGCEYLVDTLGNYSECKKSAEVGTHMFVDWYYWNDGSPVQCPLKQDNKIEYMNCKKCNGTRHRLIRYAHGGFRISCPLCGYCTKIKDTTKAAIKAWNTR